MMSRVTLAIGSFALGVFTSLFVFAGTRTPAALAQESPCEIFDRSVLPVVPPIRQHFEDFGVSGSILAFNVDSAECVRCVFNGPVLRYAGGNFQFTNFSFAGPVRVELSGAARNTVIFLKFIQDLAAGQVPKEKTPTAPIIQTYSVDGTVEGTFGTLE